MGTKGCSRLSEANRWAASGWKARVEEALCVPGSGVSKEDAGYGQRLHNDSKGETGSFIPQTFTAHLTRVRAARNWGCGDVATNAHLGLAAHVGTVGAMKGVSLCSRLGGEGVQTGETACAKALRH